MKIPTPHIGAKSVDEVAKTVLMPGDPLRAKYIAETYLTDVTCFNEVRGMLGYTGYYNGKRVSVMGSGMGIPSANIYYYELFSFYDVESIIRIGTAGGMQDYIGLRDVVIATAANTSSSIVKGKFEEINFAPTPDFGLLIKAVEIAKDMGVSYHVGTVLSGDEFYGELKKETRDKLIQYGTLAGEMESAGLYMTARRLNKKALALFTISDNADSAESSKDRETSYTQMMEIALKVATQEEK
ncbi:purine nucleoside phosphorylase [Erysipelothrix larvae]|uniref:Purine nucleoside phosphorylase DeoD-type n=1 Tax=Erysipelothrix larvae TaxID=1514105 RepID=A0A0X8GZL4_9FIRM|nr:purine nucleoside phosphorylase [Erysipelothrix larvae]